ncbi:hypothetical protein [Microbacterium sp. NPDC058389]|uniref:hypothetical protein n=1 Tax=Microbacterium sp. NPDC058389 TaxID=3346475 RepID=UPI003647C1B9
MYRMILPETLPDVVAAEAEADARAFEADAAAARTRADYGRVSRWLWGLLGTAGTAIAMLLVAGAVNMATAGGAAIASALSASILILVALVAGTPSGWLLLSLHRSGRRLARAAGYWAALPHLQGLRAPRRGDWFAVRFLGFSADLFLRLTTSALAGLVAIFAASVGVRSVVIAAPAWELTLWLGWAVLFGTVCVGQFGGVQRIQNGHLARDPQTASRVTRSR